MTNDKINEVTINEKSFEILVAKFVPTSQYFERSFEMLQVQITGLREGQKDLIANIDKRFSDVDKRFEQAYQGQKDLKADMDKRFEQVNQGQKDLKADMDKRFSDVDKRFDQINIKLDTIIERMDVKIDAGLRENRTMSIRLFSFAMVFSAISMAGLLAKMTGLF